MSGAWWAEAELPPGWFAGAAGPRCPSCAASDHPRAHPHAITAELVLESVARTFGTTVEALKSASRAAPVRDARAAAYLLLRRMPEPSPTLEEVSAALGRSDHTTAISGIKRATLRARTDPRFARKLLSAEQAVLAAVVA